MVRSFSRAPSWGPAQLHAAREPSRPVRHLGMDDRTSSRVRVVDGALRCIARCGLHKTTVDDVARESGVSRATLYRLFPGGKDAVVRAVVETEVSRLFSDLGAAMGEARDLEELLVAAIVGAARRLSSHAALDYLLEHEPGTVLPHLAFSGMDRVLAGAASFAAPFFGRWLEPVESLRAAEWAARIVLSYLSCPREGLDLTDPAAARHLVTTFVVPGIQALAMRDPSRPPPAVRQMGDGPADGRRSDGPVTQVVV